MSDNAAEIELRIKKEKADEDVEAFAHGLTEKFTKAILAVELLEKGFELLSEGMEKAVEIMKEAIGASEKAEQAEVKLAQALKFRGDFTQDTFEKTKELSEEISRQTTLTHVEVQAIEAKLITMGVHQDKLEAAIKATVGMAAAGYDNEKALKAVAATFRGETSPMLAKLGLETGDAAKNQAELAAMFEFAEAQTHTYGGAVKQLAAEYETFLERLGDAVTQSTAVREGIDAVKSTLKELEGFFADPAVKLAVDGFFRDLVGWLADTLNATLGMIRALKALKGATFGNNAEESSRTKLYGDDEMLSPGAAKSPTDLLQALADRLQGIATGKPSVTSPFVGPPAPGAGFGGRGKAATAKGSLDENMSTAAANLLEGRDANGLPTSGGQPSTIKDMMDEAKLIQKANEEKFKLEADYQTKLRKLREDAEVKKAELRDHAMETEYTALSTGFGKVTGLMQTVLGGVAVIWGDTVRALVSSIVEGANVGEAFGRMLGGLLIQLGETLLSAEPGLIVLAALSGNPLWIGTAIAAPIAGAGLIAAGAAMGAASSGQHSGPSPAAGVGASSRLAPASSGFGGGGVSGGGNSVTNYTINFGPGFMTGTPRQIARQMRDILDQGAGLRVAGG